MSSTRPPRKRQKKQSGGGDLYAPTPAQWAKMSSYGSFVVTDAQGQEVVFRLGDTAAVLPGSKKIGEALELHRYWIVKIIAIRGKHVLATRSRGNREKSEYWIKIRWFYSPTEVSWRIPGFQAAHCSKYERIYSDHSELVSPLTFNELVSVQKFHEDDPDQPHIDCDQFYTRYFLKTSSKQAEISNYVLQTSTDLGLSVGCICGKPYDVNNPELFHVMHMCPRPRCRRFHHSCCLLEHGYWTRMTHPLMRLLNSPDTNEIPMFPSKSSKYAAHLPADLLLLAAQPMVRGAALDDTLGEKIAGNCRDVTYARRTVYAVMQGTTKVPNNWRDCVDLTAAIVDPHLPTLELDGTGEELVLSCPNCYGPI
ncbi:hypothetical protein C8F04DRAFT_1060151 [Mycena alexandri]|uniref:BAH domain-containing protein n=1 Tax=Mycena alexandri TaxID=1745969 RepID=A0AAD6TMX2_9AGAR|nr:hypothetical protein C8F04DRAFT_1060151 [Mycena alexandri]